MKVHFIVTWAGKERLVLFHPTGSIRVVQEPDYLTFRASFPFTQTRYRAVIYVQRI